MCAAHCGQNGGAYTYQYEIVEVELAPLLFIVILRAAVNEVRTAGGD